MSYGDVAYLYIKDYSLGRNEEGLRVKRSFELTDFELSRFYCMPKFEQSLASFSEGKFA